MMYQIFPFHIENFVHYWWDALLVFSILPANCLFLRYKYGEFDRTRHHRPITTIAILNAILLMIFGMLPNMTTTSAFLEPAAIIMFEQLILILLGEFFNAEPDKFEDDDLKRFLKGMLSQLPFTIPLFVTILLPYGLQDVLHMMTFYMVFFIVLGLPYVVLF
jgi:hypothetical protein